MKTRPFPLFVCFLLVGAALSSCSNSNTAPQSLASTEPYTEAIGFYTDGSLRGAVALPQEGYGFVKIFRARDRAWGTRTLVETLKFASARLYDRFPAGERLQIGDLSARFGGRISRHSSHQNGIDADLAFLRKNRLEREAEGEGEDGFEERFVDNRRISPNFDLERNWFLMRFLVESKTVSRIFIDPELKRLFCNRSAEVDLDVEPEQRTEILRRLRPYVNHDDHLHVRLHCPSDSPQCVSQEEPRSGSGCSTIDSKDEIDEEAHTV